MLGKETAASLSPFVDILLDRFRRLSTELRSKNIYRDGHRWYVNGEAGHTLREASSAVCMLNELIYGLSDRSLGMFLQLFQKRSAQMVRTACQTDQLIASVKHNGVTNEREVWGCNEQKGTKDNIIHCIGSILHEYICPEVWDLPTEKVVELCLTDLNLPLHFYRDTTALHTVIMNNYHSQGIVSLLTICFKNTVFSSISVCGFR
jgi:hypothetical protein